VQVLREARVDACSLANNHILDFGSPGLIETIEVLGSVGIQHVGAGRTLEEATAPAVLERRGVTVGILGYTDNEPDWAAANGRPGTHYISVDEIPRAQADVEALRERVDVVIVTIHWGPNMRLRPAPEYRRFAQAVIDAGADVLHGHSAHVFQGIETRGRGLILYDTGDLVDDYRVDPVLRNDLSFLYLVQADSAGVTGLGMIPVRIANLQVNRAQGEDYRLAVDRVMGLSREFGTEVIEVEPGLLRVPMP
jgi:poly-gamma-glutamate capsule biosynthesis protein CapA/YwtB (metallophosphatase superfamily)